jgi:Spy/CpxP family protein refolding chaperone
LLVAPIRAVCQATAATQVHTETEQELETRLTPAQKQQFEVAKKAQLGNWSASRSARTC